MLDNQCDGGEKFFEIETSWLLLMARQSLKISIKGYKKALSSDSNIQMKQINIFFDAKFFLYEKTYFTIKST